MQKKSAKTSFSFGSMVTFLLLLLLIAGAVLLLIPQYRELRKKKQIETRKSRENDAIQNERNQQAQQNNDLHSATPAGTGKNRESDAPGGRTRKPRDPRERKQLESKRDAVEKIGREKFNLVEEGDIVIKYTVPEQGK